MMRNGRVVTMVLVSFLLIGTALPARGDFSSGMEAYLLKDFDKALKEFMADSDPRSFYQIGYMYDHAEGVPQDAKEAADWYRKAAEKGSLKAQYRMGVCYANGYGVEKNTKEAAKWFRKAASNGFQLAKDALRRLESDRQP